jgi:MFS family permease
LVRGVFTLGWGYFYYLLLTLQDLNDHWYLPHQNDEPGTRSDVFIAFILFGFLGIFALPFIQYVRYEKLRRHLLKLPEWENQPVPRQGKLIALLNSVMVFLYYATITSTFFGISTLVAGFFFTTNTILIAIAFLVGAVILLFLSIIVTLQVISYEQKWQETLNEHFKWHKKQINQKVDPS